MTKKTTPVTAAAQAVEELSAQLSTAKAEYTAAVTRRQELRTEGQRISDALSTSGGAGITEEQMIDNRQRSDAAATLADAKRRGVSQLEAQLSAAQGALIAEQIREQAGGYVSWEQLAAEVQTVTAGFIAQLDTIADRADDRNRFLAQAAEQLRLIDGGHRLDGAEVAGLRRVLRSGEQTIEVDGERLVTMPPSAVFETAVEEITTAAVPSIRYQRQLAAAA